MYLWNKLHDKSFISSQEEASYLGGGNWPGQYRARPCESQSSMTSPRQKSKQHPLSWAKVVDVFPYGQKGISLSDSGLPLNPTADPTGLAPPRHQCLSNQSLSQVPAVQWQTKVKILALHTESPFRHLTGTLIFLSLSPSHLFFLIGKLQGICQIRKDVHLSLEPLRAD